MKRGQIWTAAGRDSDYSVKPRPVLIVQDESFGETQSVIVCGLTSEGVDAPLTRPLIKPSAGNGLREASRVMVDKILAMRRDRLKRLVGAVDGDGMARVDDALVLVLGLASPDRQRAAI